jgi:hypothetical protein
VDEAKNLPGFHSIMEVVRRNSQKAEAERTVCPESAVRLLLLRESGRCNEGNWSSQRVLESRQPLPPRHRRVME